MSLYPKMADIVPPGEKGVAAISHYEVSRLDSLRDLMSGIRTDPGRICILRVNKETMMSDTHAEHWSNYQILREARGNVLIAGLGIGMVLQGIVKKPEVQSVTVVEKYQDVIDLVGPTVPKNKVTIIHGDIFTWRPAVGTKFDTIYFDIWADATDGKATPDKRKLAAAFRRYKAPGGWMKSWSPMRTFR
jgi:spermidine synthase